MKWCELTILAGASSLSDVSNVIYSIQPIAVMLRLFALLICGLLAGFSGEKSMVFKCSSDDNTTLDIQVTGLLRRQRSKK